MDELIKIGKRDPLKRNVESGIDTEGASPMSPPDAYEPAKVEGVDYDNMHEFLKTLIAEHAPIKKAVDEFEAELLRIKEKGPSRETNEAFSAFFSFFDDKLTEHQRIEDKQLFPLLHKRLLEVGEHSKGPDTHTAVDMMDDEHTRAMQLGTIVFSFFSLVGRLPDPDSRTVVLKTAIDQAESLVELLRLHLFREEEVVFPLAQKHLSQEELDAMLKNLPASAEG